MCQWCGAPAGVLDGFSVVERPAQRLTGRVWEGTYSEAAGGALHPVLAQVQAEGTGDGKQAGAAFWAGPITGISWNDRPDGFRYFVGLEGGGPGQTLELPAMRFATAWHDAGDGEVVDHYQLMLAWIEREGLSWDKSRMHHREEYPLHADFSAPAVLRLMVPVR